MKFQSTALTAFFITSGVSAFGTLPISSRQSMTAASSSSSAFVPKRAALHQNNRLSVQQKRTTSAATLSMFMAENQGGMEELEEMTNQAPKVTKQLVQKNPTIWKMAGYATIPLSAALGFGLVPSRRLAAHAVGAAVTGVMGAVGKSKMDAVAETAAKPAVAQALLDYGIDDPTDTANQVLEVQSAYGVLDEDFASMCTDVYAKYLLGMVKHNLQAKTSELKELEQLKAALQLDNLQVGEAHAAAASEWYRTTCLFTPEEELEDPEHPDYVSMSKLLFLTERALRQGGETEEAFNYEMTRVAKALNLSLMASLDRVAEVAEPFYQRALKSTRSKLGLNQIHPDMLQRARATLGISDATASDMHIAAYNEEVRTLLGKIQEGEESGEGEAATPADLSTLKFSEGALDRLEQLKDILGLSDTDAEYEIAVEATPLFQATALATMKEVLAGAKTAEEAWKELSHRQEELLLSEKSSKDLLSSMVMQALGGPLEETNRFAKVNNEAATYEHMLEALEAKEALISILAKSGWNEFERFDETFCNPRDKDSACGFLSSDERVKLYRIFLTRTVRKTEDGKLTQELYDKVMEVKGLLGVTDDQADVVAREAFGPELQKVLQTAMFEIINDYTPALVTNMNKNIEEVMENYQLSEDLLRTYGATLYNKAVSTVSEKSPAGIPDKEQNEALNALREMFLLDKEDTYSAHLDFFGPVYKKSVLEAMGATGVILPEYRPPLDELRERLGISEEAAKEVFLDAVKEKMVPMVEWIGSEMERTVLTQQQLAQKRGKDMGEDLFQTGKGATGVLGLGAEANVMSDIMNLVDFYTENDIMEKEQVGTKSIEKKVPAVEEGGEETTITEEVPVYETSYPVTALEADAIDTEMAELLYRQFVVGSFTHQGPQAARYEGAKATFGGILGLTSEKMEEISSNIGDTVYDNFVTNAMKTKTALDQQDMMFLANIQAKLGLTAEQGEKMLVASQKKVLSEEVDAIMDAPTLESVKYFREKCNAMGMDMAEDVGISKTRLTKMFEAEVIPMLKEGEITVDSGDVLTEVQESLGLSPDECETIFESIVVRLAKSSFELITGELLRGREENTVDLIKELVRYAAFVGGDLGLEVEEARAWQIFNIYEAFDFSDMEPEAVEANKDLLKIALGLS